MKNIWIIGIICSASFAHAGNQRFNLGDLEIQGEVRRPMMDQIRSNEFLNKEFEKMVLEKLKTFEAKLTEPCQKENLRECR